ncbi:glycoside hydrolase family 88 protein [Echinicola strongylocentroti]|uniref:glycoside hydrolase family 88 protein n=1 Tax=Echinicola strongylocentroti TaxID=1795355 RepID=UPI001FE4E839|nr:glycoside hydrolase family 88 protein [Echinicola strongylocentroti]
MTLLFETACSSSAKSGYSDNKEQKDTQRKLPIALSSQLSKAADHYAALVTTAKKNNKIPRSVEEDGEMMWVHDGFDWTEGFFPGSLWYLYALTGDQKWKADAGFFQELIKEDRFYSNHDLGFVFNNSFGNGLRLTGQKSYEKVLVDAANTLLERYDPKVESIKSWDTDKGWQSERGWQYPVIIDNMMNLELLFEVSKLTGDPKYADIAIKHANTTLANHFRDDYSSYHVVDYDSLTGAVRKKERAQGAAHESSWARGQAWGLYGFTMCYRYTNNETYLEQAKNIASFILSNPEIKSNSIPFWDYDAPGIPNEPKDASAAAITASALIELSNYLEEGYLDSAKEMISTLSGSKYFAQNGANHHFLLMHSVGSIPHGAEIDKPLNYADYYYLESLFRLKNKGITAIDTAGHQN